MESETEVRDVDAAPNNKIKQEENPKQSGKRGFSNNNDHQDSDREVEYHDRGGQYRDRAQYRRPLEGFNRYTGYNDDKNFHYNSRTVIRGRGSFNRLQNDRNGGYYDWQDSGNVPNGHMMNQRGRYNRYREDNGGYEYERPNWYRRGNYGGGAPFRRSYVEQRNMGNFNRRYNDENRRYNDENNAARITRRRPRLRKNDENQEETTTQSQMPILDPSGDESAVVKTEQQQAKKEGGKRHGSSRPYRRSPAENAARRYRTVMVSNIPTNMNENGLYYYMKCFGEVTNIYIPSDKKGKSKSHETSKKPIDGEQIADKKEDSNSDTKDASKSKDVERNQQKDDKEDKGENNQKKEVKEGEAATDPNNAKFYMAYISFRNKGSIMKMKMKADKEPLIIFNHPIEIADYHAPPREKSSSKQPVEKEKPTDLTENMLIKIFECMDFRTRFNVQLVCHSWMNTMNKVYTPAFDAPTNVTLRVKRCEKDKRQKDAVQTQYDAEKRVISVSVISARRYLYELDHCLAKIARQFGGGIERVEISHMIISLGMLLALGSDSVSQFVFDRCFVAKCDFAAIVSFCSTFGDRVTATPPLFNPWPTTIASRHNRLRQASAVKENDTSSGKRVTH